MGCGSVNPPTGNFANPKLFFSSRFSYEESHLQCSVSLDFSKKQCHHVTLFVRTSLHWCYLKQYRTSKNKARNYGRPFGCLLSLFGLRVLRSPVVHSTASLVEYQCESTNKPSSWRISSSKTQPKKNIEIAFCKWLFGWTLSCSSRKSKMLSTLYNLYISCIFEECTAQQMALHWNFTRQPHTPQLHIQIALRTRSTPWPETEPRGSLDELCVFVVRPHGTKS